MTAKNPISAILHKAFRTRRLLYILAILAIVGLAGWAKNALAGTAAATTDATSTAIGPALKLATGTINLEGTAQAVDATSAARLLPLWQLMAQLQDSGIAAPQEISAVTDEIKLNMTAAQIGAIDAMSISDTRSAGTTSAASGTTSAQAVTGGGPSAMEMFSGGGPMGGPGRPGDSQSSSSTKAGASSSATSTVIEEVIQLLQKKIQN